MSWSHLKDTRRRKFRDRGEHPTKLPTEDLTFFCLTHCVHVLRHNVRMLQTGCHPVEWGNRHRTSSGVVLAASFYIEFVVEPFLGEITLFVGDIGSSTNLQLCLITSHDQRGIRRHRSETRARPLF